MAKSWQDNVITWFELPVADMPRAKRFYESILALRLREESMNGMAMAVFPHNETQVSGCLIAGSPGEGGATVYLSAGEDLQVALERARNAGAPVLLGKTALPEGLGYFAQIRDCEGNRVGLFSPR